MVDKFVATVIIVITLLTPVACFAHPCGNGWGSETIAGHLDQCPLEHDTDDCDSTCCCADYAPSSSCERVRYTPIISKFLVSLQINKLQKVVIPIFIPPQNLA
jgi:hypothetical protein